MVKDNNQFDFDSNQNNQNQEMIRTNFFVSVAFLCLQVFLPSLTLFFLTSRDFSFTFYLPIWLMVILSLVLVLVTVLITTITYCLGFHQIDQFTYVIPFGFVIIAFYLTSYWFPNSYFFIRFVIAFASAVFGIFLASSVLLLVIRRKQRIS